MADNGFIEIVFTMEGQRDLVGRFAAWGANVSDMTPAWEEVGQQLLNDFAMQFNNQGGWLGAQVGPKWAPLKPSTLADRARKGFPPGPILWRTGSLIESVTTRGAPGNIFEASPDGIIVGTAHPLAGYHQYGTRGRGTGRVRHDYYSKSQGKYVTGHPEGMWVDTEIRTGAIPPRKMVGLRYRTRAAIVRILGDYVRQAARAAGLNAMGGSGSGGGGSTP